MAAKTPKTDEKTRDRVRRYRERKAKQGQKAISLTVPARHERDLRELAEALRAGRNDAPWPSPERVEELEQQVAELRQERDDLAGERDIALQRVGAAEAERDKAKVGAEKARAGAQEAYQQAQKAADRAKAAEDGQKTAESAEKALRERLEGDTFKQWLARRLLGHRLK